MRIVYFMLLLTPFLAGAHDGCSEEFLGEYSNPSYDTSYSTTYVSITVAESEKVGDRLIMSVNIPCGTKVSPALYQITELQYCYGRLKLLEKGSSQCSLGVDPSFFINNGNLEIQTEIRVPGFSGTYEFKRD